MELAARAGGTLLKQVVPAGATVPVSELVAVIGEPGEKVEAGPAAGQRGSGAAQPAEKPAPKAGAPEEQATQSAPDRNRPASMPPAPAAEAAAEGNGQAPAPRAAPAGPTTADRAAQSGRVKASPLARRMAAEQGLDLKSISGSGPEGRVIARDLEGAATAAKAPGAAARSAPLPRGPAAPPYRDAPLTQIRKTIAKRLAQSIGPIPTFYLTTEVDMERSGDAREALLEAGGEKVSFNDIILKAVAMALRQHPECNAWWQDDHIRYWNEVHLAMAVAIDEGLITPVIRHTDLKSLREIAAEARDLAGRARERKLAPEEYTGGTFSVSNLGMLDIDEFTAVINPPEAGILAVGRMAERPVAQEGAVVIRRRMRLTMSCDHRVIDGATGARFLQTLKRMLENPLAMVY
jgi:pyruvate dehydrogenase E2 component (dihydrolipoamide acetyltransferase)